MQRRRVGDLSADDETAIVRRWNETKPTALIQCAQYFANARAAKDVRMSEVDKAGFTLQYKEFNVDSGKLEEREMRIAYDRPVATAQQIESKLLEMADEAKVVLAMKPKTDYRPPGTTKPTEFTRPPIFQMLLALGSWVLFLTMAFVPDPPRPVSLIQAFFGGMQACRNLLVAIVTIAVLQAFAAAGVCIWATMPLESAVKWFFYTLVFGFGTLGPVVKIAFKHKAEHDARSDVKD
ncbi:hypothetical protein HK105_205435 [Polyrhizophydium stewartii]|uniref:DUF2470 domain-containing protein n=1 Tax=Polyrhizophydium stewartii TaxID=2732419 RepID=A0ABR4N6F2_9FUNG|nr:hypothetical protein HK105_007757 [Polyrhizophydium stewartii]